MAEITGEITVPIGNNTHFQFSIFNKRIKQPLKYITFIPLSSDDHSPEDFVIEDIRVVCIFIKDGEARFMMAAPNGTNGSYKLKYYLECQ